MSSDDVHDNRERRRKSDKAKRGKKKRREERRDRNVRFAPPRPANEYSSGFKALSLKNGLKSASQ